MVSTKEKIEKLLSDQDQMFFSLLLALLPSCKDKTPVTSREYLYI